MASAMIRTNSVLKALRMVARMAQRCNDRAEAWKDQFEAKDDLRVAEIIRAEAYRDAVQQIAEQLDIDKSELWPDLIVESK